MLKFASGFYVRLAVEVARNPGTVGKRLKRRLLLAADVHA